MNDIQIRSNNTSTIALADHLNKLEEMISELKRRVETGRGQVQAERQRSFVTPDPAERVERAKEMLASRGSITASDVQLEVGVSHTTAMRAIHALARAKEGIMVFEPAGPTFRVRLWHPDRVILDHVP